MKLRFLSLFLAGAILPWLCGNNQASAQDKELLKAIQKVTTDLLTADKGVIAARNALAASHNSLDPSQFNSAAYNARITSQQVKSAKEKVDKAGEKEKEDAQENYELALELNERRQAELKAAEELLPKRETAAKEAEDKYAVALPAAEKMAQHIKTLLRQAENDAVEQLIVLKLATEKAAFAKAKADQKAEANVAIIKTIAELTAADKALKEAVAVWHKTPAADRAKKQAEIEKITRAYALALHTAAQHLPAVQQIQVAQISKGLVDADQTAQKTQAALQQMKQEVQNRINAVKARMSELKVAEERVEKTVAKIRARKDLKFAKESLGRAQASQADAEKLLPPVIEKAESAKGGYAAALQTALKLLVQSPDAEKTMAAARAAISKAVADKEAAIKQENAELAREAAEAQKGQDKATAKKVAADNLVNSQRTARANLERSLRARFAREVTRSGEEIVKCQSGVASTQKVLKTKQAAFNTAFAAAQKAKENAAGARKAADSQEVLVKNADKERAAAEQLVQKTAAAAKAAQLQAKEAQTAAEAAQGAVKQAPEKEKPAAEKRAKEKASAAKAAQQKAKEAQTAAANAKTALDTVTTKVQAVAKTAKGAAKAAKDAEQKAAAAQAVCEKAAAEKNAAEQAANQQEKILHKAMAKLGDAKAGAVGGLKPLSESVWDLAKARHLMVRAGFGGTPDEVARLHSLGLHGAVDYLVNFKKLPPAEISFAANPKERPEEYEKSLTGQQRQILLQRRQAKEAQQIQNMRTWWLRRMVESPRPLEEKLTLFWHNHFAVQYSDVADSYYMYLQNQLFRDNAAGNFASLLHGITHDAAMLKYLNNDTNVKGRANENLAREIMELFSMGRDQGYNEIDIRQGARALTGYTYDPWTGQFRFIKTRHDDEPKTIFGKKGDWAGDDFATLILETPYPPKFIARQLFKFFAYDDPSIDVVEALANMLTANNYELAPMLENLFLSEEFYSPKAIGSQIKAPIQLVVGLHRDLGLKDPNLPYLVQTTSNMGQLLFEPPSVFGWPPGRAWVNSTRVFSRYNGLSEILENVPRSGKSGVDVVGTLLAGKQLQTHAEVVDYLVRSCFNVPLPETKRQALIEFLRPLPSPAEWSKQPGAANARLTRMLTIMVCSPEYQLT